ncbi:ATP phosphoribosyltransferase [Candidatus Vidania fulgoroideorum]
MILAIPKGRVMESFLNFFKKKIKVKDLNTRKMILNTNFNKLKILPIKSNDAYMLMKKKIDACIIGKDIKKDLFKKSYKEKKMNFFFCRLSLICRNNFNSIKNFYLKKKIKIYTKYTNITKNYFNNNFKIIKMNGSVESVIPLCMSDYIVDIIQTCETVGYNNLFEMEKIMDIYPLIVYKKKKILKYIN